jgi:hypothetical protein
MTKMAGEPTKVMVSVASSVGQFPAPPLVGAKKKCAAVMTTANCVDRRNRKKSPAVCRQPSRVRFGAAAPPAITRLQVAAANPRESQQN